MAAVQFLTDFADQAVMLPLAIVIGFVMLATGWLRGAAAWAVVIGATLGLMFLLKLWAGTCGPAVLGDQLQSPSGHTASAAAIYGGASALLLRRILPGVPVGFLCAAILALLIGVTRVLLGAHSIVEVCIGAAVGIAAAMLLVRAAGPLPTHVRWAPAAGAVVAVLVIFHGLHMPAEAAIRKMRLTWLPFGLCRTQL